MIIFERKNSVFLYMKINFIIIIITVRFEVTEKSIKYTMFCYKKLLHFI
jgi:hypothetical protein